MAIRITEKMLIDGLSPRGGYTNKQMLALTGSIKKPKGWRRRLVGSLISRKSLDIFMQEASRTNGVDLDVLFGKESEKSPIRDSVGLLDGTPAYGPWHINHPSD